LFLEKLVRILVCFFEENKGMGEGKGGADERLVLGAGKLKNQSPDQQQAIIFQFLSSLESTLGTLTTVIFNFEILKFFVA